MNRNAGSSVGPEGGAVTCAPEYGLGSETSQVERRLDKPEVAGSNPAPRTSLVELVDCSRCYRRNGCAPGECLYGEGA
jgi:hypothetical protein